MPRANGDLPSLTWQYQCAIGLIFTVLSDLQNHKDGVWQKRLGGMVVKSWNIETPTKQPRRVQTQRALQETHATAERLSRSPGLFVTPDRDAPPEYDSSALNDASVRLRPGQNLILPPGYTTATNGTVPRQQYTQIRNPFLEVPDTPPQSDDPPQSQSERSKNAEIAQLRAELISAKTSARKYKRRARIAEGKVLELEVLAESRLNTQKRVETALMKEHRHSSKHVGQLKAQLRRGGIQRVSAGRHHDMNRV